MSATNTETAAGRTEHLPNARSERATAQLSRVALLRRGALQRLALRLTGHPSDARDLVQTAFERALQRSDRFASEQELLGWLRVVMRNLAFDQYRAKRRQCFVPLDEWVEEQVASEPGARAWTDVDEAAVQRAIARLAPPLRAVLTLHLQGRTLLEIARLTGAPPSTAGTRIFRAKRQLRAWLLAGEPSTPARDRARPRDDFELETLAAE